MSLSFTLILNLCCSIYAKCLEIAVLVSISFYWCSSAIQQNVSIKTLAKVLRLKQPLHIDYPLFPGCRVRSIGSNEYHLNSCERSGNGKNLAPPSICEAQETERDDNVEPSDYSQPCEHRPDEV